MIDDIQQPGSPELPKEDVSKKSKELASSLDGNTKTTNNKKRRLGSFKIWPSHLSKKKQILIGAGLFVLVVSILGALWWKTHQKPVTNNTTVAVSKKKEEKPTTKASPLTGMQVAPELTQRAVTGIMIENSPDARPQSGLKDAGVVYEAVAEGGITRFLALFQESQPDYIGPVRSARPYYLDWLLPYDAAYAHVGGSPDALAQIKSLGVKDMDQFYNAGAYWRVNTRYAPHNMYTSMAKLDELKQQKGYTTSSFTGFARKKESANATPNATSIDLNISSYLYNVHYDYDKASNSYLRSMGGAPHTDEKANAQITPKVVIALLVPRGIESDGIHSTYGTTGKGHMYVFQDGVMTEGTWLKSDRKAQFSFIDTAGKPLKLNPGQTWITMVNGPGDVTAK